MNGTAWPIAAVLFLSSWRLHRAAQRDTATKTSGGSVQKCCRTRALERMRAGHVLSLCFDIALSVHRAV